MSAPFVVLALSYAGGKRMSRGSVCCCLGFLTMICSLFTFYSSLPLGEGAVFLKAPMQYSPIACGAGYAWQIADLPSLVGLPASLTASAPRCAFRLRGDDRMNPIFRKIGFICHAPLAGAACLLRASRLASAADARLLARPVIAPKYHFVKPAFAAPKLL